MTFCGRDQGSAPRNWKYWCTSRCDFRVVASSDRLQQYSRIVQAKKKKRLNFWLVSEESFGRAAIRSKLHIFGRRLDKKSHFFSVSSDPTPSCFSHTKPLAPSGSSSMHLCLSRSFLQVTHLGYHCHSTKCASQPACDLTAVCFGLFVLCA